jgi:hypothetical protein
MAFMGFTGVDTGLKNALKKETQEVSAIEPPVVENFQRYTLQISADQAEKTGKENLS